MRQQMRENMSIKQQRNLQEKENRNIDLPFKPNGHSSILGFMPRRKRGSVAN